MSQNIKNIKFYIPLYEIEKKNSSTAQNINNNLNSNNNNNSISTRIESNSKQNTDRNQEIHLKILSSKNILLLNTNENLNNNNNNTNITETNNNNNNNNNNYHKEKINKNLVLTEHKKIYSQRSNSENKFIVIPKNISEEEEIKRLDRFGQPITKKNKKNFKICFKDEIDGGQLEDIVLIQSIKSFNYVKGMPSEKEIFKKNKTCCSSCIIF